MACPLVSTSASHLFLTLSRFQITLSLIYFEPCSKKWLPMNSMPIAILDPSLKNESKSSLDHFKLPLCCLSLNLIHWMNFDLFRITLFPTLLPSATHLLTISFSLMIFLAPEAHSMSYVLKISCCLWVLKAVFGMYLRPIETFLLILLNGLKQLCTCQRPILQLTLMLHLVRLLDVELTVLLLMLVLTYSMQRVLVPF